MIAAFRIWLCIPAALILFAGCGRPGDGREGGSDKQEWSILQDLEAKHRGEKIKTIEFLEVDGYQIMCIPRDGDNIISARRGQLKRWQDVAPKFFIG